MKEGNLEVQKFRRKEGRKVWRKERRKFQSLEVWKEGISEKRKFGRKKKFEVWNIGWTFGSLEGRRKRNEEGRLEGRTGKGRTEKEQWGRVKGGRESEEGSWYSSVHTKLHQAFLLKFEVTWWNNGAVTICSKTFDDSLLVKAFEISDGRT